MDRNNCRVHFSFELKYPDNYKAFAYAALIAASVSLGFWAGRRAVTRSGVSSLKPSESSRTSETPTAGESNQDDSDVEGDISALRVEDSDECKMVSNFSDF